jgi:hypothetical protein
LSLLNAETGFIKEFLPFKLKNIYVYKQQYSKSWRLIPLMTHLSFRLTTALKSGKIFLLHNPLGQSVINLLLDTTGTEKLACHEKKR